MKVGSMEGLIGASVNIKLSQTPMRVYKEAERNGNAEVMERAMGYVTDFQEKAQEYSNKAQKELVKELKEEHKEQEIKRQQSLERKEETKEYIEKIQENNKLDIEETDYVEISKEGNVILKNNAQTETSVSVLENMDMKMYTNKGKTISIEPNVELEDKKIDITI